MEQINNQKNQINKSKLMKVSKYIITLLLGIFIGLMMGKNIGIKVAEEFRKNYQEEYNAKRTELVNRELKLIEQEVQE